MNGNGELIQPEEMTIRDYINMVVRHRWLIIACFSIVFITNTIIFFSHPREYMAASTFTVKVETQPFSFNQFGGLGEAAGQSVDFYKAVLWSGAFQTRVYEKAQQDSVLNSIPEFMLKDVPMLIYKNANLRITETSNISSLSVTARHPIIAYRMATILLTEFKDRCKQIGQEESRNVVDFVDEQKEVAWQKLEETEKALHEFTRRVPMAPSSYGPQSYGNPSQYGGNDGSAIQKLLVLESQLTEIQTQRELSEAAIKTFDVRLQALQGADSAASMDTESQTVKLLRKEIAELNTQHQQLLNQYGPNSDQVSEMETKIKNKRDELITAILKEEKPTGTMANMDQSLWKQIQENKVKEVLNLDLLRNREQYYHVLISRLQAKNPKMLETAIESARLQRQKQVSENLYLFLAQKGEEANIKAATGTGGVQIIDYPTIPRQPIPRRIAKNLLIGAIIGLVFGLALSFLIEYFDVSIRTPHDLDRYLHIAHLGSVPDLVASNRKGKSKFTFTKFKFKKVTTTKNENGRLSSKLVSTFRPRDPIVDNYRTICTNIQFAAVDQRLRSLLVTSSLPSEGKTITSANLAITFTELEQKVLIIDCDLRKPRQHELFGIKKSPGLTDYLVREIPMQDIIYPSAAPNLYVIPAGTMPPNPVGMIASQKMIDFFAIVKEMFDLIIVDSPPLGIVIDSLRLANQVDYVLLVVKQGTTSKNLIKEINQILNRTQTRIIGAILNYVSLGPGYGYDYKYYNYNYYSEPVAKHT